MCTLLFGCCVCVRVLLLRAYHKSHDHIKARYLRAIAALYRLHTVEHAKAAAEAAAAILRVGAFRKAARAAVDLALLLSVRVPRHEAREEGDLKKEVGSDANGGKDAERR